MDSEGASIVIVDDDTEMAEFVADAVEEFGFAPVPVSSGQVCIGLMESLSPACIIMDVVMPDMDGVELADRLACAGSRVPLIVMSGYDGKYLESVSVFAEAKGLTVIGTLTKPFTAASLETLLAGLDGGKAGNTHG